MKSANLDSSAMLRSGLSRRDVFRGGAMAAGSMAAAASFFGVNPALAARLPMRGKGPNVYQRLGVEPFINLTSTRTMNGGAMLLPEVADAIHEASFYHANLQELFDKARPYIAKMLGAPGAR